MTTLTQPSAAPVAERFHFRRPEVPADVPRLVALARAIEAVDQTGRTADEQALADQFTEPGFEAHLDDWVVEDPADPDRLIAETWVYHVPNTRRALIGIDVHPAWRNQGLGSELLRRSLDRARASDSAYVTCGFDDTLAASRRLVEKAGFRRVVGGVQMRLEAGQAVADAVFPAGYTVRPYSEINDPGVVQQALNRGFIGHWENRERPLDDIEHRLQEAHNRPAGIFIAHDAAGDIAGICWAGYNTEHNAQAGEKLGYIHSLGVSPEHRRAGLGRALLLRGIAWLRAEGMEPIELDAIGNNELALPLYEGTGFHVKRRWSEYRLDLA
jgi:mycothiol synthase